jgi:hypothetical protein
MSGVQKLDPYPKINPALFSAATSAASKISTSALIGIPWYIYLFSAIILYFLFFYYYRQYWLIETPGNIRYRLKNFVIKYNDYGNQRASRKGLEKYLQDLRSAGISDDQMALTNFHVCSAVLPATFSPIRDGIVSPDAVRLVMAAGVRFLEIGVNNGSRDTNYMPYVATMDAGSNWRRITMNQLPLSTIMDSIISFGMGGPNADQSTIEAAYNNDPLFIMLTFNGKTSVETFKQTAEVLKNSIEAYRLDFTFYGGRGAEQLFKTPIQHFLGKVIILSNKYAPINNPFNDYINIGPRGTTPLEMSPKGLLGIAENNQGTLVARIQQNLTVTRADPIEPDCDKNAWNWQQAHSLGIHFAALNFWSQDEQLDAYRKPEVFGVNSFLLKPATLRYTIEYVAPPLLPNPELNARDGKPRPPPGISMPM